MHNTHTPHTQKLTTTQLDYEAAEPAIMSVHSIMPIMSGDTL